MEEGNKDWSSFERLC